MYRVAITGLGILSPLGRGWQNNALGLFQGRDCANPVRGIDATGLRCQTAAEIADDWVDKPPLCGRRWHRSSMIVATAMREAIEQAGPGFTPKCAIVGTTSGGMSFGEAFLRAARSGCRVRDETGWVANYYCHKAVDDALNVLGLSKVPSQIVANACASGADALGLAMLRVRHGLATSALAGGYDVLSQLVFAGFDSLQALTAEKCRPFDAERTGLILGEGAAFMTLESFQSARARGAEILAEISGYGCATDTHHPTQPAPDGQGPFLAMSRALQSAAVTPEDVDYINAHGTATLYNDAAEAAAIARLFQVAALRLPVSSTKSMVGHSLGAAGAIEAVFSVMAIREQKLPPTINVRKKDEACTFRLVANDAETAVVRHVLSNSLGFAGTNASLLFSVVTP